MVAALFAAQRRTKDKDALMTSKEDVRDNVIHYDDEGGGEADTHAFDMGTLRNSHTKHSGQEKNGYGEGILLHLSDRGGDHVRSPDIHCQTANGGVSEGDAAVIREFIQHRLEENQQGYASLPYDSLATYAYEGDGSLAGSLSSIDESWILEDVGDLSSLGDWGQPFKTLAHILERSPPTAVEGSAVADAS